MPGAWVHFKILYATPNSTLHCIQLFGMTVRHDGHRLTFVSKNRSGDQRHGPRSDMAECVNDVCDDITMALYVIIKKGIKRIGTSERGILIRPPGAQ